MTAWRIRLHRNGGHQPVLVEGDPEASRGTLVRSLESIGVSSGAIRVDGDRWTADDTTPLADAGLRNGSLLSEHGEADPLAEAGTYLVAVGGPASGRAARLEVGRPVEVGRAPSAGGLAVDDPLMSTRHFAVELGDGDEVTATDLGSKNGSQYEGTPLSSTTVDEGCLIHAGASLFAVHRLAPDQRAILLGTTPTGLNIHRQFREATGELPPSPKPPDKVREHSAGMGSSWWRSLMPLVSGIGFAVIFGRWQFLLIMALAPIIYTFDNRRRRKGVERDNAAERERFAAETEVYERRLAELRSGEVRRARRSRASGGAAALLARFRHRRVWERRPDDADFLHVTLGYASMASTYDGHGERGSTERPADLWKAPLSISLRDEGPLSITGPRDRASAVARSLVLDLVVAHAPIDLHLWVVTDEERADDWQFAQWLPHAFTEDGGAHVAVTATGRSTVVQALAGLVEARREQATGHDAVHLPVHVVVVDGIDNVRGAALADLLRDGPSVGVIGIVTDPAHVPEGIRGEVQLGRFDDECSFRSVLTPRVDDVTVSQLATDLATEAALALAPLEAFGRDDRPVGQLYLTEMVRFGQRSADEQIETWRRHSPQTSVPVGVTMDGVPFHVDIVRHGPHGLIGGMTRSGKTEFLKTWFSSLAMFNHPDDLAIAIIDFKGGVDHKLTAALPHVIALATNQNIDNFERTINLLAAEHERRERIFEREAGVATIEGYRTARQNRPELPPIPRLLVVVDEFAELLETNEGKAQVGRLESFSRIGAGLGVHLLLLTQLFNSGLPPTIDGQAGLRLCFKVQNGADSKIVLKSAAAAGISSSTKGRAYARFQGGDLIEFQSARVGNEARHTVTGSGALSAHFVTHDTLTRPPTPPEQREVPNEQQDLHHIVQTMRRAAAADGFVRSAVPWPAELPGRIELDRLVRRTDRPDAVIGVADDPSEQRTIPVVHDAADAVVALAGVAGSGHHESLLTIGTALALTRSPDDLHMYGIDLVGQGLALLSPLPHVGTVATRDDPTALRILNWLVTEAARRRSVIGRAGVSDHAGYVASGAGDLPELVLLVLGADRLFLHGEGTSSPLLGTMTTVVNEIAGTGIQVVFSGTHAMLTNRLGTNASRRLVFAANDPADYPSHVDRALRSQIDTTSRCVDSRTGLLGQIAAICAPDVNAGDVLQALGDGLRTQHGGEAGTRRPPRRFTSAPWPLLVADIDRTMLGSPAGIDVPLPFGVRPETGEVMWIDPTEDGRGYRIIGPPKSGRSNALAAIAVLADRCGWDVAVVAASRRSPLHTMERFAPWRLTPGEAVDRIGDGVSRPTLLVVDDAHRLDDEFPWKKLAEVESGPLVVVAAGATEALTKSTGIVRQLDAPNGVHLMPARTRDASGVGLNVIDDEWVINPLPGIGAAGIAGEAHRVQYPLVVDPT
jgi:S-DNA-T family DNA segregation ATPase FtsK/SpoIIIE